ncbi:hypothetical protein BDY19DRAFT_910981 [Irpex rosettiformis]|uniref:Uncharacterized protein n=1 Tax=Irpex rosettiformis TaxID=378272 RepID=A0ACB8TLX3_9APHY|nr:hypothetical protein BDY19DRAFT_910981 [Irpex rosettiformis]
MARTKQKPKKSTGGHAPRVPIGSVAVVQNEVSPAMELGVEPVAVELSDDILNCPHSDECCGTCLNGGTLVECACGRTLCNVCAPQLTKVSKETLESCTFRCAACERSRSNYRPSCYFGLYRSDETPLFPTGLRVEPQAYVSIKSRMTSPRICIIDIHLPDLIVRGGPGHLLHEYLYPWYHAFTGEARLHYVAHPIDLVKSTLKKEEQFFRALGRTVETISYEHIFIFLTTHSDETRGDLFYEANAACPMSELFEALLAPLFKPLAQKDITFFLLACGGVVDFEDSRNDLQATVNQYNINNCFAFTTKGLIGHAVFPFVNQYVQSTLLQDSREVGTRVEELLDQCLSVGRHTHICWFKPNALPVRYAWTENTVRPWGHQLPYQCPSCLSVYSWSRKAVRPEGIEFYCTGAFPNGTKCTNNTIFTNSLLLTNLPNINKGKWMKGGF